MPISSIIKTVDDPIPTWKGTLVNDIPDILTIEQDPPPISGSVTTELPFHCSETIANDGGVINSEKVKGTIFEDQK